ncbi:MAG: glycosyltransferase family 2 protein [Opitutales bacterium]
MKPTISIVIPFYNEEETVVSVLEEVVQTNPGAEIIAVNDGSGDRTAELMQSVAGVRALNAPENRGQSAALYAGLKQATGEVCVMMDGDGQNDPADIPALVAALTEGIGMVCGYRAVRKDTASRRWASKIANRIRVTFINDGIRDTGCSLKCFHREAVDHLVPFNGMHRYMAAFMKRAGLTIAEIPVNHRSRHAGTSKYTNWDRALRGIYDLFGVSWLLRRKVKFDILESDSDTPHS